MPAPKAPNRRVHYVYELRVGRAPFYVGIGHSTRASDRVRYLTWKMRREDAGFATHWRLSDATVREFLRAGHLVTVSYVETGMNRAAALRLEREHIESLLAKRRPLANTHFNPGRLTDPRALAMAVLARALPGIRK